MQGKFITVEGTEGVGKSTNITFIRDAMIARGIDVFVTREPGGTPLAEELRGILLQERDEIFDPTAELLIMFAARAQHLNQVIIPALKKGQWVLSDRFTDATYAYQGYGRGLNIQDIETLETMVQGQLQPDCTFFLDIDVALGLQRARARADLDRFENQEIAFFETVRAGYLKRIEKNPSRYKKIDAGQDLDAVQRDISQALHSLF